MIKFCGCVSNKQGNKDGAARQDAWYGKGFRLHTRASNAGPSITCTVCGKREDGSRKK